MAGLKKIAREIEENKRAFMEESKKYRLLFDELKKLERKKEQAYCDWQETKKRKRECIFSSAIVDDEFFDLKVIGEMIKKGLVTKKEFHENNFDNEVLTLDGKTIFSRVLDVEGYEDCMFCMFYDFSTGKVTDHKLKKYDELMKDSNKINLFSK